jgi:PKD repeat protein
MHLARKIAAAILMCIVMVVVASAPPVVGDTHTITKGDGGPNANAVTWEYVPISSGEWMGHIVNDGLRWLTIDVYENTAGTPVQIMHQRIRFAEYDAFPTGEVDTKRVVMSPTHSYLITATPNGPKGSYCTIEEAYVVPLPPVPILSCDVDHMNVTVSASGSFDPDGTVVSYAWSFGDGAVASGFAAIHTYVKPGTYVISLELTDNDGLTSLINRSVDIVDLVPIPSFTYMRSGLTISVDASNSSDDYGIVSFEWDWGDGSAPEETTSPMASHTYSIGTSSTTKTGSMISGGSSIIISVPYVVFGYVYDPLGNPVFGAPVTITDLNTGSIWTTTTDFDYGYYMVDIRGGGSLPSILDGSWVPGDTIRVTVEYGGMVGSNEGIIMGPGSEAYLWLDVYVTGGHLITLTVTDTLGQTGTVTQLVPI